MLVAPRGQDRGPGAPEGDAHRAVLVLVAAQLLAVARYQQQRIVGAHPEDQHQQDARRLAVDHDAGLGEPYPLARTVISAKATDSRGRTQTIGLR